jgi:hypothetical protein
MPRHSDHLNYAINLAKYFAKKAKSDTERRRMFDRFCVLANLYPEQMIKLSDDPPANKATADDNSVVKPPTLDEQAAEMVKKLKGGE